MIKSGYIKKTDIEMRNIVNELNDSEVKDSGLSRDEIFSLIKDFNDSSFVKLKSDNIADAYVSGDYSAGLW